MGLGQVTCKVGRTRAPVDPVVALLDAVLDPEVTHIYSFTSFQADRLIGHPLCCSVVCDDWCRQLNITKISERSASSHAVLTVQEATSEFGFSREGDNDRDDGTNDVNGAVGWDVGWLR